MIDYNTFNTSSLERFKHPGFMLRMLVHNLSKIDTSHTFINPVDSSIIPNHELLLALSKVECECILPISYCSAIGSPIGVLVYGIPYAGTVCSLAVTCPAITQATLSALSIMDLDEETILEFSPNPMGNPLLPVNIRIGHMTTSGSPKRQTHINPADGIWVVGDTLSELREKTKLSPDASLELLSSEVPDDIYGYFICYDGNKVLDNINSISNHTN